MKRITSILLALSLGISMVAFSGCGENSKTENTPEDKKTILFADNENGTCSLYDVSDFEGTEVVIPDENNGKKVTKIEDGVFAENDKITSVVIPESVKDIGASTFLSAKALKEVTFNGNPERLDTYSFLDCPALEKVTFKTEYTHFVYSKSYYYDFEKDEYDMTLPCINVYLSTEEQGSEITEENKASVYTKFFRKDTITVNKTTYNKPESEKTLNGKKALVSGSGNGSVLLVFDEKGYKAYKSESLEMPAGAAVLFEGTYTYDSASGYFLIEDGNYTAKIDRFNDIIYLLGKDNAGKKVSNKIEALPPTETKQ